MDRDILVGVFYLAVLPVIFFATAVWYMLIRQPLMILVLAILGLIYLAFMSDDVSYGPKQIRKVQIPMAPQNVQKLLKTTSQNGELIYVFLLSAFGGEETLSQTDLVNRVRQQCEDKPLTHQAIRATYIVNLERLHLIESPKRIREYEYVLTEQGRWCSEAARICFPKSNFGYIKRHYLKLRKLEQYPSPDDALGQRQLTHDAAGNSENHNVPRPETR